MTQNIYDDANFLAGYSQLPRSVHGLAGAPEWPRLRSLLPDLDGARVLDLGCGFGWFCEWAADAGAADVVGLDVSHNMLARARAERSHPSITYEHCDLETLQPERGAFDVVYSSLALHYIADLPQLLQVIAASTHAGSTLVFSAEHPIHTAPGQPGFVEADGTATWPLNRYLDEGQRTTNWLAEGVVKHHRTVGTHVNGLIAAGFAITFLEDWGPDPEQLIEHPEWSTARESPAFLLVAAEKC